MEPMARSRKNVQLELLQPHQEALLPSSTFPLLDGDPETASTEKTRQFSPRHQQNAHQHSLHCYHHHHHHRSLASRAIGNPSVRLWTFLACAVVGTFVLYPSLLSPSSSQAGSHHDYPTSRFHRRFRGVENYDFTLGGLFADSADQTKCRSRGLIHRLRATSPHKPSAYLVRKLREYETLHRRCGPGTESFIKSANMLQSSLNEEDIQETGEGCKYIVWIANSGLGNRLVSIASAFVYALLTQRVLVLDGRTDLGKLLCEPFPGEETTWFLPPDFAPLSMITFNESSPYRFGLHLKQGTILPFVRDPPDEDRKNLIPSASITSRPSSVFSFLHLSHRWDFYDKLFFCEKEQSFLHEIPWLFLNTNLYFVPSLYLYLPEFRQELTRLFPETESVFHHVSRYLFLPTNSVWSWILRYYDAYLAKSAQIIGVQIRSFVHPPVVQPHVAKQILTCALENNLLPKVLEEEETETALVARNSTAVLVTSLLAGYWEEIMEVYANNPTKTGEVVSVYQPSFEMHQNTGEGKHNMKAWAEMCLLSFSDKLITSPMSTFGYVAQGLGGIRPWILVRVQDNVVPSPACTQGLSIDPCYHAPPYFNCDANQGGDTTKVLPYVKHCEDLEWGLKVFPNADS